MGVIGRQPRAKQVCLAFLMVGALLISGCLGGSNDSQAEIGGEGEAVAFDRLAHLCGRKQGRERLSSIG